MSNQRLYNEVLRDTISNVFLHNILIMIDYYPIFISSISLPLKFSKFNIANYSSVAPLFLRLFPFRIIPNGFSNILNIILFILIIVFILVYVSLFYIEKKINDKKYETIYHLPKCTKILRKVIINFYDLFFFRYGSGYIIFFFINILFSYTMGETSLIKDGIAFAIIVVFASYYFLLNNHIQIFFTYLHIENKELSEIQSVYPFDWILSRQYDLILSLLKLIVGFEYFMIEIKQIVDYKAVLFEIMMIILQSMLVLVYVKRFLFHEEIWYFMFNKIKNFTRIHGLFCNLLVMILFAIFVNDSTSIGIYLFLVGLSYLIITVALFALWQLRIKPTFYDGTITLPKLIYLTIKNPDNANDNSYFHINLNQIIDTFMFNHRLTCSMPSVCLLCTKYLSKAFSISAILQLFKYLSKTNQLKPNDKHEIFYFEIMNLFYYHYKKKLFKFYTYRQLLFNKYSHSNQYISHNISCIVQICLSYYDKFKLSFYRIYFVFCKINKMIDLNLANIKEFVNLPSDFMHPEKFFELANDLRLLKDFIFEILKKVELEEKTQHSGHSIKSIKSVCEYNLVLNRYIVEKLVNRTFSQLAPLNIELKDDYLFGHYSHDKILMVVMDLNNAYAAHTSNYNYCSFKILENGRELSYFKGHPLIDLFPKKFRNNGIQSFISHLSKYKENTQVDVHHHHTDKKDSSSENLSVFEYLMNTEIPGVVEHFKYSFKIAQTLDKGNLLIHGFYKFEIKRLIVFSEDRKNNNELNLFSFSSGMLSTFMFKQEWIDILSQANYSIPFTSLFKTSKNNGNNMYECTFDMRFFYKHVSPMFSFLLEYYNKDKVKYDDVVKVKIEMRELKDYNIKMKLNLIFDINIKDKHSVYSVSLPNSKGKGSVIMVTDICKSGEYWENEDMDEYAKKQNDLITVNTTSISSMTETINSKFTISKREHNKRTFSFQQSNEDKICHITKSFKMFSCLIVVLNGSLIVLCVIFLIIQIKETNYFAKVNELYGQYKTIRLNQAHTYLSILSNVCVSPSKERLCHNEFKNYSHFLIQNLTLDPDYDTHKYILEELVYKVKNTYKLYFIFKENLYSSDDRKLISILTQNMTFYIISQEGEKKITHQYLNLTFEEGLRHFINTVSKLLNTEDMFDTVPINILRFNDKEIDYSNVYPGELSVIQKEIYQLIINYIFYVKGYDISENLIMDVLLGLENTNQLILIVFMVLIGSMNLILGGLCLYNVYIVENLFINFISQLITLLSSPEYNEYFNSRLDYMVCLNKLYVENPNNIIESIKKEETRAISQFKEKNKKPENNASEAQLVLERKKAELLMVKRMDRRGLKELLKHFLVKINAMIVIYLIIAISFDTLVFIIFKNVFTVMNYVISNMKLDNLMYTNIVLNQIRLLLSLKQSDVSDLFQSTESDKDGFNNMMIRKTEYYLKQIMYVEAHNFKPIQSNYKYQCEGLFETFNDDEIKDLVSESNINYYKFQNQLCERFNMLHSPNFNYLYDQLILKNQMYHNIITSIDYADLYAKHMLWQKYELYTITLVIFKPLRRDIRIFLIGIKMSSALTLYINMVWVFLCFNIVVDAVLFLIIKLSIVTRLNNMHKNLQLLSDCFQNS